MSISVVIHTLNSGKLIRKCLESVKDFDEIIVCDMYSEDDTLSIAEEFKAKIVMFERSGGIPEPARAFAVNQATKKWVLVVDSDEVIPEALKSYLYQTIASENFHNAYYLPRKNFFMKRFMRAAFPDYQLRFFKKSAFKNWPVVIHARPEIEGSISKIPKKESLAIVHLDENRIVDSISKMNRYTELEIDRRINKKKSIARIIFQPFYRFFFVYFIKGGCCDGKEGLIYSIIQGYNKFCTNAKIIEKQEELSGQSGLGK